MTFRKADVIEMLRDYGHDIPADVRDAPDDVTFSFGWTPGGFQPLFRSDQPRPAKIRGIISIDPLGQ